MCMGGLLCPVCVSFVTIVTEGETTLVSLSILKNLESITKNMSTHNFHSKEPASKIFMFILHSCNTTHSVDKTSGYCDETYTVDDIYPRELKLKKTSTALSYLDVKVTTVNGKYCTAIHDKRDISIYNH